MLAAARSRGGSTRLMALLLSLVALFSVAQLEAAPTAKASTSRYWSTITWDITGISGSGSRPAANFRSMISQIRQLSGNFIGVGLLRTTSPSQQYIEIMVIDNDDQINNHRLSLYLRLDNLYLDGFTVSGRNYRFSDAPNYLNTRFAAQYPQADPFFERLPYSSHYSDLASQEARGDLHFSGPNVLGYLQTLYGLSPGSWNHARNQLAATIALTSEAARFGWIENRIAASIQYGGEQVGDDRRLWDNLGPFGAELENSWNALSSLVWRQQQGQVRPVVTIDNRTYNSVSDIVNGIGNGTPRIAPFLTLGTSR